MDGMKIKKILPYIIFSSLGLCTGTIIPMQTDATHEINALANENSNKESITEQVVLGNFANIVQNFFSIVQNPHNAAHVGANITQMLAGIVNVAVEVMKNLPSDITPDERAAFIRNVELSLKASLRAFTQAKKNIQKTAIAI